MKKLHLLCNAHLDPAWLWRWNEGLAEAISTFRVAVEFCNKYDGFIFNHNEALLYEWVEEHEPELFKEIKRLVEEKKWIIMGGWYLQSDCVMTSGESLMEQIKLGNEYFLEKFGVKPKIAINFDPFGHSRGLVQILKNFGYEGYIFMRPNGKFEGDFLWQGFDGSVIKAHGIHGGYNTLKGKAVEKIKDCLNIDDEKVSLCLWGIGNHGGGPSRIDLENINELIDESDDIIVHSSADDYFSEVNWENKKTVNEPLISCMVGCYTSMVRIKQANRRVENKIAVCEKIMNYAEMTTDFITDNELLNKAKKSLAFCQFHDILPGSAIKTVEEDSLNTLSYAEDIVDKMYMKAFFKMCEGQKQAQKGEIPILIFNPHPYEIEDVFECEFLLENQNWNDGEKTLVTVYDSNGKKLHSQNEEPLSNINLDWVMKVSFKAKLKPSSVNRFDCKLKVYKTDELPEFDNKSDLITVKNEDMTISISRKSGLIEDYTVKGIPYIKNSGKIEVYKDDEDPWGSEVDSFNEKIAEFELMSDNEVNEFLGYPDEKLPNVRIIEDGEVRTKIQAFFSYKRSVAILEYTIPKDKTYFDVHITLLSNEVKNMLKYRINSEVKGTPYGETAFAKQVLYNDNRESVFHKWCGIESENNGLYVINNGTYGGSFTEDSIKISLLRTPLYSSLPIKDRPLALHDRFFDHIDLGMREFSFRITTEKQIERMAQIYNETPRALSFFPSGKGEKIDSIIEIDNENVILSSLKKSNNSYYLTLYNYSDTEQTANVNIKPLNKNVNIKFGCWEIKKIDL